MLRNTDKGNKFDGFYRGIVLKHCRHGKCKIFVPGVYDETYLLSSMYDLLPDAEQASPIFAGTNNGNGVFSYPNISSIVVISFFNGDQNYPVYWATTLGGENAHGQYDAIKSKDEYVSNRHLITSGPTHIEMFENGIISACIKTPCDNAVSVDYKKDEITREITDNIYADKISNVLNYRMMSNLSNDGLISDSIHYHEGYQSELSDANVSTYLKVDNIDNNDVIDSDVGQHHRTAHGLTIISTMTSTKEAATLSNLEQSGYNHDNLCNTSLSNDISYNYNYANGNSNTVLIDISSVTNSINTTRSGHVDLGTKLDLSHTLNTSVTTIKAENTEVHEVGTTIDANTYNKVVDDNIWNNSITDTRKTGENAADIEIKATGFISKSGTPTVDAIYLHSASTTKSKVEISLTDNVSQHSCKITMDGTGKLCIETSNDVSITSTNTVNVTTQAVNVKTNTTTIDSSGGVSIIGNTTIDGTLHVTGDISTDADVAAKCTLNTHQHSAGTLSNSGGVCGGNTGPYSS